LQETKTEREKERERLALRTNTWQQGDCTLLPLMTERTGLEASRRYVFFLKIPTLLELRSVRVPLRSFPASFWAVVLLRSGREIWSCVRDVL